MRAPYSSSGTARSGGSPKCDAGNRRASRSKARSAALLDAAHAPRRHRSDYLRACDTVDEIALAAADILLDQAVDVGVEARKALVEIACELQVLDDLPVEALAGNQQRNPRRVRRQQHAGDAPLELVDLDAFDLAMRHPRERIGGPHRGLEIRQVHLGGHASDVVRLEDSMDAVAKVPQADLLVARVRL